METGREGDELVTGQLTVDGVLVSESTDAIDRFDFPALTLNEGQRQIRALVTDTCGNIGSVAGFDNINGQPNWARPLPLFTRIDSIAPGLTLGGVGGVLAPEDDADGDSTNGFQTNATVTVSNGAGLEQGQPIELLSNGAPVSTTPDPLTATGEAGALAVQLTVPPGQQSLVAQATDQCGNTGTSAPVDVDVRVDGCLSQITNLPGAITVLGAGDGDRDGDTLSIEVLGLVELLDEQCLGANVELVVDNAVVQRLIQGTEVEQALRQWQLELANLRDTEHNIESTMGDGDGRVPFPGLSKESLVAAFPDIGLLEEVPVRFPSDWEALSEDGDFAGLLALVSLNIEFAWFVTNRLEERTQTLLQALHDREESR